MYILQCHSTCMEAKYMVWLYILLVTSECTMYRNMYIVQYIEMYNVQYIKHVHCTMYRYVQCTMYQTCTLYNVSIMYIVQCIKHVQCTMYRNVQCIKHVHCTMYRNVQCTQEEYANDVQVLYHVCMYICMYVMQCSAAHVLFNVWNLLYKIINYYISL